MATGEPSAFWKQLGDAHAESMAAHGLDTVKRRQALRYFTWQWRWRHITKSEQMRYLLTHTPPATLVGAGLHPGPLDDRTWDGTPWSKPDRWLYVYATRLLWAQAVATGHPATDLPEPTLGDPLPVQAGGRLVSQDLANTALELDAMRRGGADHPTEVVEIGAGYGRTAYAVLSLFPDARYTIVDIEPTISISRWYLSQQFDADRLTFVPADELDRLEGRSFDLGLSISSLQEMTPAQVGDYLRLLDDHVHGHVFLKQWERWHNPIDETDMVFEDYPIPATWKRMLWERCAVQTKFMQGLWETA